MPSYLLQMQTFLSEYRQKYALFVRVYMHTQINTHKCTNTRKYKNKKWEAAFPCGLYSRQGSHKLCRRWPRWHSDVMGGVGAAAVQWQQFCQLSKRNLCPAEPVRAVLSSPPVTAGFCMPHMLHLLSLPFPRFDNLGASWGCSCMISPNWLLWH